MKYALIFILTLFCMQSRAAVHTVTSNGNDGPGTLRSMISTAALGDTIQFAVTGEIVLATQLVVGNDLLIQGPGVEVLALNGDSLTRIMQISGGTSNVRIRDITFKRGKATLGGAIFSFGTSYYERVAFRNNSSSGPGGAVDNVGIVHFTECEFSKNHAGSFGGALVNNSANTTTLTNCTLSGNTCGVDGAAIYANGTLTISHCTITENFAADEAGGIFNNTATIFINNTILAGNKAVNPGDDVEVNIGNFVSSGYNLIGITDDGGCASCFNASLDLTGTAASPLEAYLGPLQNNGGSTLTHALSSGSPAIDAADPGSPLTIDQRGQPRNYNGTSDIGALELNTDCPVPGGASATVSGSSVSLNWNAVPAAFGYQLQGQKLGSPGLATRVTGAVGLSFSSLAPGATYSWRIRAGCPGDTSEFSAFQQFTMPALSERMAIELESDFSLFPNPATRTVFIKTTEPVETVCLYNLAGLQLLCQEELSIDLAVMPAGQYVVETVFKNGNTAVKNLVIGVN